MLHQRRVGLEDLGQRPEPTVGFEQRNEPLVDVVRRPEPIEHRGERTERGDDQGVDQAMLAEGRLAEDQRGHQGDDATQKDRDGAVPPARCAGRPETREPQPEDPEITGAGNGVSYTDRHSGGQATLTIGTVPALGGTLFTGATGITTFGARSAWQRLSPGARHSTFTG